MTVENGMRVSALAGWFGAGRTIAENVGAALAGCSWVGIPFAGSMSEVPYIGARTILCNDKHRHVINLARVIQSDRLRPQLIRSASEILFHPDELAEAQEFCKGHEPGDDPMKKFLFAGAMLASFAAIQSASAGGISARSSGFIPLLAILPRGSCGINRGTSPQSV